MKIGITGPISEVNFGDYGMLVNNIYDLGKEHEYTCFFYERNRVTEFDNIINEYFQNYYMKKFEICFKDDVANSINIQKVSLRRRIINKLLRKLRIPTVIQHPSYLTPLELLAKVENYNEIKNCISNIDILIVNGGGYFNDLWATWYRKDDLYKIMIPIILATQMKKKIFFTGNSYGPFDSTSEFYRVFFNSLEKVKFGTRDQLLSSSYLKGFGIHKDDIVHIPDDLLILNNSITEVKKEQKLVEKKYVVIETYVSLDKLKKYENIIIEFLKTLYMEYGYSIVFLPFQKDGGGELQGKYFQNLAQNNDHFYLYDLEKKGFPEIRDVHALIKNASFVVGTRYHTLVMALGAKTPVINILKIVSGDYRYYYNKNFGVLNMVFENQIFDPNLFLFFDQKEAYQYMGKHIQEIINEQSKLFNEKYENNLRLLLNDRNNYLKEIIES